MQNYLDSATNTDVVQANTLLGDYIQLAVDFLYSVMNWAISAITDNFANLLILFVLGIIGTVGYKYIGKRMKMRAMKG